eukprot:CAMPEP_0194028586 /NCGR_PEP_ID=MMETSP0009_2-20130614/2517_1 /TAXON_ID=210454 /ORGANISM="Grammatophora oceanica, Strain CCMP 410" /LENGTH=99 /DNA_ID=CAMNT_0038668021 /DNA_START=168 /DNA_END=468 /DNA_ORIENTATION=+
MCYYLCNQLVQELDQELGQELGQGLGQGLDQELDQMLGWDTTIIIANWRWVRLIMVCARVVSKVGTIRQVDTVIGLARSTTRPFAAICPIINNKVAIVL